MTSIVESPKFDNAGLLNSLGGALSLFLGVSIIMLFEWLELIVRLLTYLSKTIKDSETRLLRDCNISNETHSKNQIICFRRFSDD